MPEATPSPSVEELVGISDSDVDRLRFRVNSTNTYSTFNPQAATISSADSIRGTFVVSGAIRANAQHTTAINVEHDEYRRSLASNFHADFQNSLRGDLTGRSIGIRQVRFIVSEISEGRYEVASDAGKSMIVDGLAAIPNAVHRVLVDRF